MSHDKPTIHSRVANMSADGYQKVLNTALRILTGRDHFKAELIRKLKQRGYAPDDIERAVAECERLDYINDERSARFYVAQLIRKGYGLKRIDYEMNKKGLKGEHIRNIISESVSGADELEAARRVLNKNIRRFEREADFKKRRDKIYRYLYTRGFSPETIRRLMNST